MGKENDGKNIIAHFQDEASSCEDHFQKRKTSKISQEEVTFKLTLTL
jgi:hypothetical protein